MKYELKVYEYIKRRINWDKHQTRITYSRRKEREKKRRKKRKETKREKRKETEETKGREKE